jgi:hypothetical protein
MSPYLNSSSEATENPRREASVPVICLSKSRSSSSNNDIGRSFTMRVAVAEPQESRNGDGSLLGDFKWWMEGFKRDRKFNCDELFKQDSKMTEGISVGAKIGPA